MDCARTACENCTLSNMRTWSGRGRQSAHHVVPNTVRTTPRRSHGTTGEHPIDRLAREPLGALPPADRLAKYRFEVRKVSRDGFVSYDGVRYGVPWKYSGRDVKVRVKNGRGEVKARKVYRVR